MTHNPISTWWLWVQPRHGRFHFLSWDGNGDGYFSRSDQVAWNNADAMDWVLPEPQDWTARYDGPSNDRDRTSDPAVDTHGNAYLTGYLTIGSGNWDMVTVKYGPKGNRVWEAVYAVSYTGSDAGPDYVLLKYDPWGNLLWERRYANGERNIPMAVALDPQGDVLVGGWSGS